MAENRRNSLDIRRLSPTEWAQAFPVVAQLRSLDKAEFLKRTRLQSYSGYELVGAFQDCKLTLLTVTRPRNIVSTIN